MTNGAPLALAETSPALLTLGISLYSAVILICIGVGINAARHGRRRLAIVMAVIVGATISWPDKGFRLPMIRTGLPATRWRPSNATARYWSSRCRRGWPGASVASHPA